MGMTATDPVEVADSDLMPTTITESNTS